MEIDEIKGLSNKEIIMIEKRYEERLKYYYSIENQKVYELIIDEMKKRKLFISDKSKNKNK